jgi:hypothetical protein
MHADHSMIALVVRHPFGPYEKGAMITDPKEVRKWAMSHPEFVTPVAYEREHEPVAALEAPASDSEHEVDHTFN